MSAHKDQGDLFKVKQVAIEGSDTKASKAKRVTLQKGSNAFLAERDVAARYGVHRSTIWRWVTSNPKFPNPVKLGPSTSRWRLSDLLVFEASCPEICRFDQRPNEKGR